MKNTSILLTITLSAAVAFGVTQWASPQTASSKPPESAYDRVLRTGELRCGYADWQPFFATDATGGAHTGVMPDVMAAVGEKLHLKIIWAEDTGWGSLIESLRTGKIDCFCAGLWQNAERGRYAAFTAPILYNTLYPYVRTDDHRFDADLTRANAPDIRISTLDGEMSAVIAKNSFPQATSVSLPQLSPPTDMLVNVSSGKADLVFTESSFAEAFIKQNPNSLRRAQETPYQIFPTALPVEIHETQLRDMLDSALTELRNQGTIAAIVKSHVSDNSVLLVAPPYTLPSSTK